ncbi:MAG: prepilin-type N-terminal cleavage/methylation domain-containing protein [Candidatus Sungbacteria bacterium]|nr:prepilin-type N-terminal cleavage/methylation domain-containing protein [Candidatus Sungbacteria bacterium]
MKNKSKGFTLIELLVVIAIIGVLASIVLASLNSARRKSRDARRITDIKQIQLALELFFDGQSNQYPLGSTTCSLSVAYGLEGLQTNGYIPQVPRDPLSGSTDATAICYRFASGVPAGGSTRTTYHLSAQLEDSANPAFTGDKDCNSATGSPACVSGGATYTGQTTDGTTDGTNRQYDVVP